MPHIPGHEDSRNTRLKVKRVTIRGPSDWAFAFQNQMLTRDHIALRVALHDAIQPISARNGPGINKQHARRHSLRLVRLSILNRDSLAMLAALDLDDVGV